MIILLNMDFWASMVDQMVKNLPATQLTWVWCMVGKIPCRREWLPSAVFLPGEFHEQGSLVGFSAWGRKEPDTTGGLSTHRFLG